MKYITVPYLALGFVLSLAIGVEYNCVGDNASLTYYGSPFVFKEKSLSTSMEHYYSISGLVLNVAIWSILLCFVRLAILRLIEKTANKKIAKFIYKGVTGLMIVFTTLHIAIDWTFTHGFGKGSNYWYMDLNKEAEDWEMKCEAEWITFKNWL